MNTIYTSTGLVLGNCWGGGKVIYRSKPLSSNNKNELLEKAKQGIVDGSLDSGFGFESLQGAVLDIVETETIIKNGKDYSHNESELELIGDLNEEEQESLLRALDNY
jgi:hypothetical protein